MTRAYKNVLELKSSSFVTMYSKLPDMKHLDIFDDIFDSESSVDRRDCRNHHTFSAYLIIENTSHRN